jgi:dipeptidyl aminopeptidase/acylaminoacyl peptidase
LNRAGTRLLYNSTRRNGNDNDLYMVAIADPKSDHLVAQLQGGGWGPLDISADGKMAILQNGISVNESHLFLVNLDSGEVKPLTPAGGPQIAYNSAVFAVDDKSVYLTSDENSEFQELRKMDIPTGKTVSLTSKIPWDVDSIASTLDRSKLAFIVNNNGSDDLYVLDTSNDKFNKAKNIPVGVMSGLTWNAQGDKIGFSMSNAKSSSDAYSYDAHEGRLARWTASETGGLDANKFQDQKLIKWKSFDGKEISGWLTVPPSTFSGPRPVMIDIHGGPEGQAQPLFQGRYNYYINEMGIAVIEPNVRGSTGFGKTFMKLDNGVLRGDTYKDIGALLDWIQTQPNLDAKRVMITGGSYGGHMTYAISYAYADRIACSLPVVGMTNLVTFLENTSGYRRDLRRVEYGDERDSATRKVLEDIAPMNHAAQITKPVFIVAGQNDPRVPISEATQFETKIKATNPNTWMLIGKDEGHGFAKKKNRDYQMYATVLFMQKFLLGP